MIQRKQSLFLLQSIFLSVALLFVPSVKLTLNDSEITIGMVAFEHDGITATAGHSAAVAINFGILALVSLIVFLYNRRELQVKLIYVSMVLWLVLGATIAFCPFAEGSVIVSASVQVLAPIICLVAIVALYFAQKFIKKDIALLKSADRIR